jgi:hypothetical protein
MKKILLSLCAAALSSVPNFHAHANTILNDAGAGPIAQVGENPTFGYDFTVGSTPLMITALGLWDGPEIIPGQGLVGSIGDGFFAQHQIGLWDNSGNLLATAAVQIGTGDTLMGEFRYSSVLTPTNPGPVILLPNTTYVLGAAFSASDPDELRENFGGAGIQATFDPAVNPGDARAIFGGGFSFPSLNGGPGSFVGPNAIFSLVTNGNGVPEGGSTLLMLVIAGSVLAAFRARARRVTSC